MAISFFISELTVCCLLGKRMRSSNVQNIQFTIQWRNKRIYWAIFEGQSIKVAFRLLKFYRLYPNTLPQIYEYFVVRQAEFILKWQNLSIHLRVLGFLSQFWWLTPKARLCFMRSSKWQINKFPLPNIHPKWVQWRMIEFSRLYDEPNLRNTTNFKRKLK